jgi:hypothetical protein
MSHNATRFYAKGVGSQNKAFARKCIANQSIAQHILDQTVVFHDACEIIIKTGRYGVIYFVRSFVSSSLYFPVAYLYKDNSITCTCGLSEEKCPHIRYLKQRYELPHKHQEVA